MRRFFCGMLAAILLCTAGAAGSGCAGYPAKRSDPFEDFAVPEENKLVVYTSHKEEVYHPVIREFEELTGIWVEVRSGGTAEMLEQIREDAPYGEVDIMFGGGVESLEAYRDSFAPYRPAEAEMLDQRFVSEDDLWTPFTELPIVLVYNRKLVSEEEAPKGWHDLLTDRWKGQISFADPGRSGTSYTVLSTLLQITGEEPEPLFREFADALEGTVAPGSGEALEAVSAGEKLVGITLEESALKEIARGADIAMVYPEEGTSAVPDGCAVAVNAPHEANARRFVDFIISETVQKFTVSDLYRRPIRQEVGLPEGIGEPEIITFDIEGSATSSGDLLRLWAGIIKEAGQ